MMTIDEYAKPKSIKDAYDLLKNNENASVIGGGMFLRLGSREIGLAVDLYDAQLDFIHETDTTIEIGSMVTLGELERSNLLKKYFSGIISNAASGIAGTQFRNMATLGGTVCSRLGFSEIITCLLALDCSLHFYRKGVITLDDFLQTKPDNKDILEKVVLQKKEISASYQVFKNTSESLPLLSAAVSNWNGDYKISVGARPGVAKLALKSADYLKNHSGESDVIEQTAHIASAELTFSEDRKASQEYRRELCKVLVKRALMEVVK